MPTTSPRRTLEVDVLDHLPLGMQRVIAPTSSRPRARARRSSALRSGKRCGEVAVDHAADDAVLLDRLGRGNRCVSTVRPSRSTVMRSATLATSLSLCEIRIEAMPCSRNAMQAVEQRGAVGLVEARGRLVQDQQPHLLGQRLGDLDQLLLADAEIGDQRVRRLAAGRPAPAARACAGRPRRGR